ncbi:MAG: DNA-binding transcriptional regulator, LacI/PurR family [Chloroflexi bacterium AL-W]|nr:DNA-binding transcriptional regulator, LacI/PurR family [Chloroflexi bacterium AL-N1]NOK67596.1 DNA-binding transcriptional regulator, LacI/PurR family [Chloroflexi bacterium AL-N10]NOK75634.1 DNA-binding transcriptional regulator, LacI/PurR family [Chloroflexi bacterium AL-N5]NOK82422.1 DNA-binding transcriptional regulator, LacI/PurR family [Chloroflexi bacterium AL-W]NOK90267.1 DNA-binding transcriptional regulator, LacI/PurR family [Chloroflexi bacterium AL-N15]
MSRNKVSQGVTIQDVAREAGVSYATVSRVVNNKSYIKSETRERVMQAITRLGYVVNPQARSLAGGQSQVIGLVVQELGSEYIGGVVRGVDMELDALGYNLMLYVTHRRKTRESTYVTALTRGLSEGLLLVIPRNAEAYLETLRQHRFPYVLVDYQGNNDENASVGVTNRQGAYAATCYLMELGHHRIGFITGIMEMGSAVDRLSGYRAALTEHGLVAIPELVVEGNFDHSSGYLGACTLLDLDEPPTAIFASNDESATGVMDAIRDRGLRIPDDVSVMGFDDVPRAASAHPGLTTVRQPLEEMGRVATKMLLESIKDPDRAVERVILPTELILRNSCQRREP